MLDRLSNELNPADSLMLVTSKASQIRKNIQRCFPFKRVLLFQPDNVNLMTVGKARLKRFPLYFAIKQALCLYKT
jgi:hypothetical protein